MANFKATDLSFEIVTQENSREAADCISDVFFMDEPNPFYDVLEKLAPDIAMTSELEERYLEKMNFKTGECVHLFQLAILPEYRRLDIGNNLIEKCLQLSVTHHFRYAVADCTSIKSVTLLKKYGFEMENSIKYNDFIYKGKKPSMV